MRPAPLASSLNADDVVHRSRGVQVLISDDRTHKVSSAYMHMICVYRKSGCPFILKLTKSKEGGWITKSARAIESESSPRPA